MELRPYLKSVSATLPSRAMTNLLLVRSVRKGEIIENSTEKYHGTFTNTCSVPNASVGDGVR